MKVSWAHLEGAHGQLTWSVWDPGSDLAVMQGRGHDPGTPPDVFSEGAEEGGVDSGGHQLPPSRCPLQYAGQDSFSFNR